MVFRAMYAAACKSTSRGLRVSMMYLLDKISRPHQRPLDDGWIQTDWEYADALFFLIRADAVENIDVEVRRCRWAEELKVAHLFTFWSARPGIMVTVEGQQITRNKWVYDAVTGVLSPKRIAIAGRSADICEWLTELPMIPRVYHIHSCSVNPPAIHRRKACDYHRYVDENPELTVSEVDGM